MFLHRIFDVGPVSVVVSQLVTYAYTAAKLFVIRPLIVLVSLLILFSSSRAAPSATPVSSLLLLLLEGRLVWPAFDRADPLSLLGLSLGLAPFLFPCEDNRPPQLAEPEFFDILRLTEDLDELVHSGREFGHEDHDLEVFGDYHAGSLESRKVGGDFVHRRRWISIVWDLCLHYRLELEVGGDNPWFSVFLH